MLSILIRVPSRLLPAKLEQAVHGHRCLCDALLLVEENSDACSRRHETHLTSDDNFVALYHHKKAHAATQSSDPHSPFLTAEPTMLGGLSYLFHGVPTPRMGAVLWILIHGYTQASHPYVHSSGARLAQLLRVSASVGAETLVPERAFSYNSGR
jgi:hypothetical protein